MDKKQKAFRSRYFGYSIPEISEKLKISKSTASLWLREAPISLSGQKRLLQKRLSARKKSIATRKTQKQKLEMEIENNVLKALDKIHFDKEIFRILCAVLYWAEGEKTSLSLVSFTNSDPQTVSLFLKLLRQSFVVDNRKFRALVHIHEYHNDSQVRKFWSRITGIPLNQFFRSYKKPHTGKRIKKEYRGTISVRYYDYRIALELHSVYNELCKNLGA
jgi:hypothetical protein